MKYEQKLREQATEVLRGLETNTYLPNQTFRSYMATKCIIRIGNDLAKLSPNWALLEDNPIARRETLMKLVHESNVLGDAYAAGLSVPQPKGIKGIKMQRGTCNPWAKVDLTPGLVMEFVRGKTLDKLNGDEYSLASSARDQEFEKAERLGFLPGDHLDLRNSIWVPEQKKVYLIDFANWSSPSTKEEIDGVQQF